MVTKSVIFLTIILIFTNLVNSELVYPTVVSSDCPIHGPSNTYAPVQGLTPLVYSPSLQNDPNEINEELGKIIVSKLLTNPTLNAILNQHYGAHHVPSTPNVVNNYFIVPKDVLEVKENEDITKSQKKAKVRGVQNLVHESPKTGKVDGYHTYTEYVNGVPVDHKYSHGQKRRYTNIPYGAEHDIEDVPRQAKHSRKHKSHKQQEHVPRKEKPVTKKQSSKRHKQISPQDLAIINDFKRKYPGLPDNIIYSMFFRMKKQFTKANPTDTNKKEAPTQIEAKPVEKEVEKKVQNQPKPRRRIKPANENRVTEKVSNDTVAVTTEKSTPVTTKQMPTTTEPTIVTTQPTTHKYFSSIHTSKPMDTTTKKINIDEMIIPELGTEDAVPTIYSNYGDSDDYYPDFTMDSNFYVLGEDYEMEPKQTVARHASEKNYNAPEIESQQRLKQHLNRLHQRPKHTRKNPRNRHNSRRRYNNHKTKLNQTHEHSSNLGLDNPGFVTTKVKSNYESENDSENEVFINAKRNDNVETVFASSKVVNYGNVKDYSDEETTTINNRYYIDDNGDISSDRTASVVIAKSYNYPEDYS